MRLNVADIKDDAGAHKTAQVEVSIEPVDEASFPVPFHGKAEAWNTGDSILVKARLKGEAVMPCSRCLAEVHLPLEVDMSEEFLPGTPLPIGDQEETEEGRVFTRFQGDEIDLAEPLRQNILLELPMKPLCKSVCKGLCPACGVNLNEEPCRCSGPTTVDPRLAALEKLLQKPEKT